VLQVSQTELNYVEVENFIFWYADNCSGTPENVPSYLRSHQTSWLGDCPPLKVQYNTNNMDS